MSDVVTTRLSMGVRQFIETQPFMFVGTACGGQAGVTCDIVQSRRDANGDLLPVARDRYEDAALRVAGVRRERRWPD